MARGAPDARLPGAVSGGLRGHLVRLPAGRRLALAPAAVAGCAAAAVSCCASGPRRLRKFEEQFPESLEFMSRSMRAGHAFSVSLEMLHKEFQEPLAGEFRRTFDEHNLGLPLDAALQKLAHRLPIIDVQFFVSAVMLQKRTGGNLAELLDKLAYVIRERFKLRGRIRAVSAHGRMTGTALSLIPAVVAGMMFFANREYVTFFFTDPTGRTMMYGALVGLQSWAMRVIQQDRIDRGLSNGTALITSCSSCCWPAGPRRGGRSCGRGPARRSSGSPAGWPTAVDAGAGPPQPGVPGHGGPAGRSLPVATKGTSRLQRRLIRAGYRRPEAVRMV